MELRADVVVVGAGPAGATTALNLAATHRVLVLDRAAAPVPRIGESLPAAARRLLADMGVWDAFERDAHSPCHANVGRWGGDDLVISDTIRDLDGHGWHLDRNRFDGMLVDAATRRGAAVVAPASVAELRQIGDEWRIRVSRAGREFVVRAPFIVLATGRRGALPRALGARRTASDRLVCDWAHGIDANDSGVTVVCAARDGWWYTAPLPAGRRVLAFHTDADLPAAIRTATAAELAVIAREIPTLCDALASTVFPATPVNRCAAHTAALQPPAGATWIAVGDAASACDPLASQGIFHALYTGLVGALAVDRHLSGDDSALADFAGEVDIVHRRQREQLAAWYGAERRWLDEPFWARRGGISTPTASPAFRSE